ncbi:MAG: MSCRAMM family protein [bacterium]
MRGENHLMMLILMIIIIFFCIFSSCNSIYAADISQEFSPDQLVLLEIELEGWRLKEEYLVSYRRGDQLFLPIAQLSNFLEIDFAVDLSSGRAGGIIYSEEDDYLLDLESAEASINGETFNFDKDQVVVNSADIYLSAEILSKWLPLDFKADFSQSLLNVESKRPLPLQLEKDRLYRWSNIKDDNSAADETIYPFQENSYSFFSGPFIDQEYRTSYENGELQPLKIKTDLRADFLFMTGEFRFLSSSDDKTSLSSAKLGRREPEPRLLGPLNAHEFWIGDISQKSIKDIKSSKNIEGFMVSSFPYDRSDYFDSHSLDGELPEGWEVELYKDDTLIDFASSNEAEEYLFEDLPINYGQNEFTLVFYDELEQKIEKTEVYRVNSSQIPPGEHNYEINYGKDDDHYTGLLRYGYGLNRDITLNLDLIEFREQADLEEREHFGKITLTGALSNLNWQGSYLYNADGGWGVDLDLNTDLFDSRIAAEISRFHDFSSPEISGIEERTELEMRRSFSIPGGSIYTIFDLEQKNSEWDYSMESRLFSSFEILDLRFRNYLRNNFYEDEIKSSGELRATKRFSQYSLRGILDYNFDPDELQYLDLNLRGPIQYLNERSESSWDYNFELGYDYDFINDKDNYFASITRDKEEFEQRLQLSFADGQYTADFDIEKEGLNAGLLLGYDKDDNFKAIFNLSQSLAFDHNAKMHSNVSASEGAASLEVYVDQGGEKIPLEDIGFEINGSKRDYRTDAEGNVLIPLKADYKTDIAVDLETIKNPFLVPGEEGISFTPRRGKPYKLEIPFFMTGEITGQVYLQEKEKISGLVGTEVQLIDKDSEQITAAASTSFDGFFYLKEIPPGEYLLKVSDKELERRGLKQSTVESIIFAKEGGYIGNFDILLEAED